MWECERVRGFRKHRTARVDWLSRIDPWGEGESSRSHRSGQCRGLREWCHGEARGAGGRGRAEGRRTGEWQEAPGPGSLDPGMPHRHPAGWRGRGGGPKNFAEAALQRGGAPGSRPHPAPSSRNICTSFHARVGTGSGGSSGSDERRIGSPRRAGVEGVDPRQGVGVGCPLCRFPFFPCAVSSHPSKEKVPPLEGLRKLGAGGGNRTPVSSLGSSHNNHYTTPAVIVRKNLGCLRRAGQCEWTVRPGPRGASHRIRGPARGRPRRGGGGPSRSG